jgi:hypothetical protein
VSSEGRKRRKREKVIQFLMSIETTSVSENISLERRELLEYIQRLEKRVAQIRAYPDGNE